MLNSRNTHVASATLNKRLLVSSDESMKPMFPVFRLLTTAKQQALDRTWPLLGDNNEPLSPIPTVDELAIEAAEREAALNPNFLADEPDDKLDF